MEVRCHSNITDKWQQYKRSCFIAVRLVQITKKFEVYLIFFASQRGLVMYLGGGTLNSDILVDLVNGITLSVGYKHFTAMFATLMSREPPRPICYELK